MTNDANTRLQTPHITLGGPLDPALTSFDSFGSAPVVILAPPTTEGAAEEANFFKIGTGEGTDFAAAFELAREIGEDHINAARWNRYIFHVTDGESDLS